jgi:cell division transport system ATP-binding protein
VIRLTSVYKEYPRSGTALRDVTLHVNKGELVFLTGHSGAGKSTILRLIQMADLPSAGEVRVSGFSSKLMRRRDIPQLRRKLGVVFQDFRLLRDRTAEENIAFALEVTGTKRSAITPRVNRLLTQVGWPWRVRWPTSRWCCWRTSPRVTWTSGRPRGCSSCFARSTPWG